MIKKSFIATISILLLVVSILAEMQFEVVDANPFSEPSISIESPKYYKAEIYQTTSIPIEVRVYPHMTNTEFVDVFYSLDGGANTTLSIIRYETSSGYFGKGTLDNLTNGYHSLKAYSTDTQGKVISANTTFLVNTKVGNDNLIATLAIAFSAITISVVIAVVIHKRSKLASKQSFL
jgi:hypothetical protein